MSDRPMIQPSRRQVLNAALGVAGAAAALRLGSRAARAEGAGRTTDTVRLTWGFSGLPLLAKQRGKFARQLAKDGIKTEWIGPFPNHAPSIQAVTGGSADFSFGGSTTPALAAIIAGSPLVFTQFFVVDPRSTAIIAKDGSGIDKIEDLAGKTVAVNRSGLGEFLLVAALEKHHVDRKLVKIVYLNRPKPRPPSGQARSMRGRCGARRLISRAASSRRTTFSSKGGTWTSRSISVRSWCGRRSPARMPAWCGR